MLPSHRSLKQYSSRSQGHQQSWTAEEQDEAESKFSPIQLLLEIKIHRNLNHQNIVKFDSVFEDKNYVYIIMELCGCRVPSHLF